MPHTASHETPYILSNDKDFETNDDTPFHQLTWNDKLETAKELIFAAISNIFSTIGGSLKDMISLYFIGHLNKPFLFAAAGFGLTWTNAFGSAIISGFAGGFGTIASQAFGAKNYEKLGLLYQKTIAVISCLFVLLFTLLWFTQTELVLFGFEAELAAEVGRFIRWLLLDLVFLMLFESTKYYLIAQNLFHIPASIVFVTTILHILWCYIFVNVYELELVGVAIAKTITNGTAALLIFLYIKWKNPCPESWFPWVKECLQDLVSFAKEIGTHGSSLYFESIAFEMTTVIIAFLGDITVIAAHSAALNYLSANAAISIGLTISTSVLVGNAVGEGSINKVIRYANIGLVTNIILITLLNFLMYFFVDGIASFYTSEESVKVLISTMLIMYFFGMHGDLISNALSFILRALGQDRYVLKGFLWAYYGVGVTCSLMFGVGMRFSYWGVWGSLNAGFYVMFFMMMNRFRNLDWASEVKRISYEMRRKTTIGDKPEIELYNFTTVV